MIVTFWLRNIIFDVFSDYSVTQICDQITWYLKSGTWCHTRCALTVHWLCMTVHDCAFTVHWLCNAVHDCAHSRQGPKWIIIEWFSGTRGKCLVTSGTSDCAFYFVTLYVQNVSHKQFKNRYFGSLFLDSSTFVIWTREKFDSWNVYKEGISSQNEAIKIYLVRFTVSLKSVIQLFSQNLLVSSH